MSYASSNLYYYKEKFTSFMRITSLPVSDGKYELRKLVLTYGNIENINPYKDTMAKKIVNLGDSIFGNNDSETGISHLLSDILKCTVYNCAFGGTRAIRRSDNPTGYEEFDFSSLVDSIISGDFTAQETALTDYGSSMSSVFPDRLQRLKNIDFNKADIVTLNYGTNDYGGYYVKNNYIEGYTEAISKLQEAYPHIKVILITPTYRLWYAEDGSFLEDGDTRIGSNGTTF